MEHQKILNLLKESRDPNFVKRQWNTVNDESHRNYVVGSKIVYNIKVLKSNLCDYNISYIFVRVNITITWNNLATEVPFKRCAPFNKWITKIDGTMLQRFSYVDV